MYFGRLSPMDHKIVKRAPGSPCFESSEELYFSDAMDNDAPNLINEDGKPEILYQLVRASKVFVARDTFFIDYK